MRKLFDGVDRAVTITRQLFLVLSEVKKRAKIDL